MIDLKCHIKLISIVEFVIFEDDELSFLRTVIYFSVNLLNNLCKSYQDSAVSALVYAHFLAQQNPTKDVLPMLNVLREELPLKTEVIHCIGTKLGLDISNILCRDDLPLESLSGEFQLVLVDHHALTGTDVQFSDQVTEIIDHRPIEKPPSVENARIELVGSCTTLVRESHETLFKYL